MQNQRCESPLTRITIELVLPFKLSTRLLSLIFASDPYSFQYVADVSPYLGARVDVLPALIAPSQINISIAGER
jgi:hypothetical protein